MTDGAGAQFRSGSWWHPGEEPGGAEEWPRPPVRGLRVQNIGGWLGWAARRRFPALATRAYFYVARRLRRGAARRRIAAFAARGGADWFTHLELETVNRCNGRCAFCPVNAAIDPRPRRLMPEGLFGRIVSQLADIGYAGYLNLYSNNEPLLDDRLEAFASEARRALPKAFLNLSTNGTLLTVERFAGLIPHFDRMLVNNYRDRPEMFANVRAVHDFCLTPAGRRLVAGKTVEISLRNDRDILTSRGGSAPNRRPPAKALSEPCVLPFSQLVVRPDGGASLCCNDALGQTTLGDLNAETLAEVWFGPAFAGVRRALTESGRGALPLCRLCDFVKQETH